MARKRIHMTEERDNALFDDYCDLLKKYGKLSTRLSKMSLYKEISDKYYIQPDHAGRIIRTKLQEKGQKI
ncbi:hypothetical protein [Lentimicrobium sp.]|uniref:hypothetical protein n=1 Tax=Lentimicrobium sp. TaxID=2034841 RepID=UPI00345E1332